MKKILTLFSLLLLVGFSMTLTAGNYKLDQSKVDAVFATADQATTLSVFDLADFNALQLPGQKVDEKDPVIALVLCSVLGYIGAHRLYLGTETMTFVLYLITAGGCGIITLVDWVQLLMVVLDKKPLDPYTDNPNFIMWKDQIKK